MSKPSFASRLPLSRRKSAAADAPSGLVAWVPDLLAIAGLVVVVAIVVAAVA